MQLNETGRPPGLLVADDEIDIAELIATIAGDMGYEVILAHEGVDVAKRVAEHQPDVILLDLVMPHADCAETLRELARMDCAASIVLMSGMDQRTLDSTMAIGRDLRLNIVGTLTKPMNLASIEQALRPLMERGDVGSQRN